MEEDWKRNSGWRKLRKKNAKGKKSEKVNSRKEKKVVDRKSLRKKKVWGNET